MGMIEAKAFKSGDGVAVELPAESGISAGTDLSIVWTTNEVRITVRQDEAVRLAKFRQMLDTLDALGPVPEHARQTREDIRIEFPDRPGLY